MPTKRDETMVDEELRDVSTDEPVGEVTEDEAMLTEHWFTFDELPALRDAKEGDEITITVRVVEKDENGARVEAVSARTSASPITPDEAQKLDLSELEKRLPRAE